MRKRIITFLVAGIIFIVDYISKFLLVNKNISIIKGFLEINYSKNYGAAWSIMQNQRYVLVVISLLVLFILIKYMLWFKDNIRNKMAFGLLMGGLLGNLLDRIIYGYVRDFISFKFGSYYFPTFNVADSAIVIGVLLLVVAIVKKEDSNAKN